MSESKFKVADADYEEPNCMTCMRQDTCQNGEDCGPENWWRKYRRVISIEND